MLRRSLLRCSVYLAVLGFIVTSVGLRAQDDSGRRGRKYKAPPLASRIEITILKADNGKPIGDAAVIFHPIEGDKDKGSLELKTNEDGKAVIDVIPIGDTVRLQVIANGFQTYGQDYKVDKAEMSMEVRLKRPRSQYSIYKENGATANSGSGSGSGSGNGAGNGSSSDKSAAPPKNSAPPARSDKDSGSGSQNGSKPDAQSTPNEANANEAQTK